MNDESARKERPFFKRLWPFFLGGALGGYALSELAAPFSGGASPSRTDVSAGIAGAVASIYVLMAAIVIVMGLVRRAGMRGLDLGDDAEFDLERPKLLYGGIVLLCWGLALYCMVFTAPVGILDPSLAFWLFAAFMVLGGLAYFPMLRRQDELEGQLSKESCTLAYYLLLAAGGSWAALAHGGLAAAPAALDWLSMFWGLMLVATFLAAGRRGLLKEH